MGVRTNKPIEELVSGEWTTYHSAETYHVNVECLDDISGSWAVYLMNTNGSICMGSMTVDGLGTAALRTLISQWVGLKLNT